MRRKPLTPELSKMKEKLAEIAEYITTYKNEIKAFQQDYSHVKTSVAKNPLTAAISESHKKLTKLSNDYRHMHIAYSELRGVDRLWIERKNTLSKPLFEERITHFKFEYRSPE